MVVTLLPLLPASLTHKTPQRRKLIHDMLPEGRKDRSIDRFQVLFLEYLVRVIFVVYVVAVVSHYDAHFS